jgi:hypothetical protein
MTPLGEKEKEEEGEGSSVMHLQTLRYMDKYHPTLRYV